MGKVYIRNGLIVEDATEEEIRNSRVYRFPGTGYSASTLEDKGTCDELRPVPPTAPPPPKDDGDVIQVFNGGPPPGPPRPPRSREPREGSATVQFQLVKTCMTVRLKTQQPAPSQAEKYRQMFCEAWAEAARKAGRQKKNDPNNNNLPSNNLPALTPVQIINLKPVLPAPPLPMGYAKSCWDAAAFLGQLNSDNPDELLKAVADLLAVCQKYNLDGEAVVKTLADTSRRLSRGLKRVQQAFADHPRSLRKVAPGATPGSEIVIFDIDNPELGDQVLADIDELIRRLNERTDRARQLIRDYEYVGSEVSAIDECIESAKAFGCLGPLVAALKESGRSISFLTGPGRLECFGDSVQPRLLRLRLLVAVLTGAYRRQRGRKLFFHPDCAIPFTGTWARRLSNRLSTPNQGRENPNWTDKSFQPLHFHFETYANNLIYSWQNDNLYIHGKVSFHMESGMSGAQRKEAGSIEERGRDTTAFVELVLLSEAEAMLLSDLLELSPQRLDELRRQLGE